MDEKVLEQAISSYDLPEGFEVNQEQSVVTSRFAVRTLYEKDGTQVVVLKLRCNPDSETALDSHASMISYWRNKPNSKMLEAPPVGDDACLVLTQSETVEGGVTKGEWGLEMRWEGFDKDYLTDVTHWSRSTLSTIYSALPVLEGNPIYGNPATHCRWQLPIKLKAPLSHLSLNDIKSINAEMGITHESMKTFALSDVDASYLTKFKSDIAKAAQETQLRPEIIAAVILSELRGLDTYVFHLKWFENLGNYLINAVKNNDITAMNSFFKSVGEYLGNIGVAVNGLIGLINRLMIFVQKKIGLNENFRDWLLSTFYDEISLGLAQRQVNSIKRIEAYKNIPELNAQKDSLLFDVEINSWLWKDKTAIRLCAHFIRTLAQQMGSHSHSKEGFLREWANTKSCGIFDLARFHDHGSEWSLLHVNFLGWKYNTGHMEEKAYEIAGRMAWGDMFQLSYQDILEAGIWS